MITYKFTASEESGRIFKHVPGEVTTGCVEVPVRLYIPMKTVRKVGTDKLQDLIKARFNDMTIALFTEISQISS